MFRVFPWNDLISKICLAHGEVLQLLIPHRKHRGIKWKFLKAPQGAGNYTHRD